MLRTASSRAGFLSVVVSLAMHAGVGVVLYHTHVSQRGDAMELLPVHVEMFEPLVDEREPEPEPEPEETPITLGAEASTAKTDAWIGSVNPEEPLQAQKAEVDQTPISVDAGQENPATPPEPASTQVAAAELAPEPAAERMREPSEPHERVEAQPLAMPEPSAETIEPVPTPPDWSAESLLIPSTLENEATPSPESPLADALDAMLGPALPEDFEIASEPAPVTQPGPASPISEPRAEPQAEPQPAESQPAEPQPATPGASKPGQDGTPGDQETPGSSKLEPVSVRMSGQAVVAHGLEIKTKPPRFSIATMALRMPRNPIVNVKFGRNGKVQRAWFAIQNGQTMNSGSLDVDEPVLRAIHQWTAKGAPLTKLPADNPDAGVVITIRVYL